MELPAASDRNIDFFSCIIADTRVYFWLWEKLKEAARAETAGSSLDRVHKDGKLIQMIWTDFVIQLAERPEVGTIWSAPSVSFVGIKHCCMMVFLWCENESLQESPCTGGLMFYGCLREGSIPDNALHRGYGYCKSADTGDMLLKGWQSKEKS